MAPVVHGLEAEYADRMTFSYLDIDDPATAKLKEQLGYKVQPHFFLLDGDGNVVEQWRGAVAKDVFTEAFEGALAQ